MGGDGKINVTVFSQSPPARNLRRQSSHNGYPHNRRYRPMMPILIPSPSRLYLAALVRSASMHTVPHSHPDVNPVLADCTVTCWLSLLFRRAITEAEHHLPLALHFSATVPHLHSAHYLSPLKEIGRCLHPSAHVKGKARRSSTQSTHRGSL